MDGDEFKTWLGEALRAQIPEHANRKAWFGAASIETDTSERMLRSYAAGDNECPGSALIRCARRWPDFRARLIAQLGGAPQREPEPEIVAQALEDVARWVRKRARGEAGAEPEEPAA